MKEPQVKCDFIAAVDSGPRHGNLEQSRSSFRTIRLPEALDDAVANVALGRHIIDGWREDGIVRLQMNPKQIELFRQADIICRRFFNLDLSAKTMCMDKRTYSGYTASGEEITNNIEDLPEIFTVMKDLPPEDERVRLHWPCHGPCPWPSEDFKAVVDSLMKSLAESGEILMQLTALGLGLRQPEELTEVTKEGWNYMRILRYPPAEGKGVESKLRRGIGPHTDYGLIALTAQDSNGGLWVSPPDETENSGDGQSDPDSDSEEKGSWVYVPPVKDTLAVFPGDMMSYLTSGSVPATLHKVSLSNAERYSFAYFVEPAFNKYLSPVNIEGPKGFDNEDSVHYGSYFTRMFMRNCPTHIATRYISQNHSWLEA